MIGYCRDHCLIGFMTVSFFESVNEQNKQSLLKTAEFVKKLKAIDFCFHVYLYLTL